VMSRLARARASLRKLLDAPQNRESRDTESRA
jgi:hypothetical protein